MSDSGGGADQRAARSADNAGNQDYEYTGLVAETWDLLRGDTSGWPDRAFFQAIIRESGEPALDVGCATGRLVLDYLAEGLDADGLDVSPEMLALCRRKAAARGLAPRLFQQRLETLALPRRYRTIIVPSSTLQLLLDPADAAAALRRLLDHLEPGGTLAASFMRLAPDPTKARVEEDGAVLIQDWKLVRERVRPEDGATIRRWSRTRFDRRTSLEDTWDRFEVVRDGVVTAAEEHTRCPATREYTQEQSAALYRAAGFEDVRLTSGFTPQPAAPEDPLWCVVGRRPA